MAHEIVEGINPTRMELLSVRKKRMLGEKGHKLLGEKRDALVVQFFEVLDKRKKLQSEVRETFEDARGSIELAEALMGYETVSAYSRGTSVYPEPEITTINIMGVKVPVVNSVEPRMGEPPWGIGNTPAALDLSTEKYRQALSKILQLAETEGAMERLAVEIEKTKRRVNALEHIFIPRLRSTEKYITMQLQEREREEFFRRKRIKAIMESGEVP